MGISKFFGIVVAASPLLLAGSAQALETRVFGMNTIGCKDPAILESAENMRKKDDTVDISVLLTVEVKDGRCVVYKAGDIVNVQEHNPKTGMSLVTLAATGQPVWVHTRTLNQL